MARTDVYLNINAASPASAVVAGSTDLTSADFPELVLGDSPEFNFLFTDGTDAPPWAGNSAYSVVWSLGFAQSGTTQPLSVATDATPISDGWSLVLPLNTAELANELQSLPLSQEYPVARLWQQLRVEDPDGNPVTYAFIRTRVRLTAISSPFTTPGNFASYTQLQQAVSNASASADSASGSATAASASASTASAQAASASAYAGAAEEQAAYAADLAAAAAASASTASAQAASASASAAAAAASESTASVAASTATTKASEASASADESAASAAFLTPSLLTLTDAATVAWDISLGAVAEVTLGGNRELTISNAETGGTYLLIVRQGSPGSRLLTWPSAVKWPGNTAPTLTTAAGRADVVSFVYDGTVFYGSISQNFVTS